MCVNFIHDLRDLLRTASFLKKFSWQFFISTQGFHQKFAANKFWLRNFSSNSLVTTEKISTFSSFHCRYSFCRRHCKLFWDSGHMHPGLLEMKMGFLYNATRSVWSLSLSLCISVHDPFFLLQINETCTRAIVWFS